MKTRVILTLCIAFVLGLASSAHAQLRAGSPEAKAYDKIDAETNPAAKETLLLDFEKQFPQSPALLDVYRDLMTLYTAKNDTAKINEYGEKIIKIDPSNVTALTTVARNYTLEKKNIDTAIDYSQKSLDLLAKMKTQPPPANYTADSWRTYVEQNENAAKGVLAYAKNLKARP